MEPSKLSIGSSLILILFVLNLSCSIKWISLQHSHLNWNLTRILPDPAGADSSGVGRPTRSGDDRWVSSCNIARRRYGLAKLQAKLCRMASETMPFVQQAAALAAETCKTVFKDRRWNCSSVDKAPRFSQDLVRSTREQAYVYAISSAALTYTLAKACASGSLYHCACGDQPGQVPEVGTFKWGGCADNVKWGSRYAKRFVDVVEKHRLTGYPLAGRRKRDGTGLSPAQVYAQNVRMYMAGVNLHNNKIGRKAVTDSVRTQCKCHGVSGSCSIKTCWRAIPSMKDVGLALLKSYTNARELTSSVLFNDDDSDVYNSPRSFHKRLVYLAKSPDYCSRDERLGSVGTAGRICNVTSAGLDGCRQLCCGRGYRTVVEEKIERCNCKYFYCCYVKCSTCRSLTKRHECS